MTRFLSFCILGWCNLAAIAAGTGTAEQGVGEIEEVISCNWKSEEPTSYLLRNAEGFRNVSIVPGVTVVKGPVTYQSIVNEAGVTITKLEAVTHAIAKTSGNSYASSRTTGDQSTLFVMVNFPGSQYNNWPTTSEITRVTTNAIAFYKRNSEGMVNLKWQIVAQPILLDQVPTDFGSLINSTSAKLTALGGNLNPALYARIVIFHPYNTWTWAGIAILGGKWVALNGNMEDRVMIHELGHTFGLWHANMWRGYHWDRELKAQEIYSYEYGDCFDPMGYVLADHFSARSLYVLGWLTTNQVTYATNKSATYRIYSSPSSESPNRLLSVILGKARTNEQVWVEFVGGTQPGLIFRGSKNPQSRTAEPTGLILPFLYSRPFESIPLCALTNETAYDPYERYSIQVVKADPAGTYADICIQVYSQAPLPNPPIASMDISQFHRMISGELASWTTEDYKLPIKLLTPYDYPVRVEVSINGTLYYQLDNAGGIMPWHVTTLGTNKMQIDVINSDGNVSRTNYTIISYASANLAQQSNTYTATPQGCNVLAQNQNYYFLVDNWKASRSTDLKTWESLTSPHGTTTKYRWWKDRLVHFYQNDVYSSIDGKTWQHIYIPNQQTSSNKVSCSINSTSADAEFYYLVGYKTTTINVPYSSTQEAAYWRSANLTNWTEVILPNYTSIGSLLSTNGIKWMLVEKNGVNALVQIANQKTTVLPAPPTPDIKGILHVQTRLYYQTDQFIYVAPITNTIWTQLGIGTTLLITPKSVYWADMYHVYYQSEPGTNAINSVQYQGKQLELPTIQALSCNSSNITVICNGNNYFISETVNDPYSLWCDTYKIDPNGDSDRDGISNIQEYIQGTSPLIRNKWTIPTVTAQNIVWPIQVQRLTSDYCTSIEVSTNLVQWSNYHTVNGTDFTAATATIQVKLPKTDQSYIRLRLTR